ncbi:hypothetical protein WCX18_08945 [Sulfurimonas sp. HSL1-2]|uniref:hypothetical protein n=1 Tax=Thiomicrolovo zhangzhouensis TaxID=3131933 RepID=UPI0031F95A83
MKTLFALVFTAMLIGGCSDQNTKTKGEKSDHVLRQEIDVMREAKRVIQMTNDRVREQDEQADALPGH